MKRPTAGSASAFVLVTGVLAVGCGGQASSASSLQPHAVRASERTVGNTTQAPAGVLVPDVVGLSFEAAANRLRSAGFQMIDGVARQTCRALQDDIVVAQTPPATTRRQAGTRIRLTADVYEADACGSGASSS